jgi:hypothetical protein
VQSCYLKFGLEKTVEMLDSLKNLGFTYATKSGLSIGIDDLVIPKEKAPLVDAARDEVIKVESQYLEGAITTGERYNKVFAISPRMQASCRICCYDPLAPESAMMYTGLKNFPVWSISAISPNISSAIFSVTSDQTAMILL